jgi:hypothetical protein
MTGDQHEAMPKLMEIIMDDGSGGEEHGVEHDTNDRECDERFLSDVHFKMTGDAQMTLCLRVNGRHGPSSLKLGDHGKPGVWEEERRTHRCTSTFPKTRGLSNLMAQAGFLACGSLAS